MNRRRPIRIAALVVLACTLRGADFERGVQLFRERNFPGAESEFRAVLREKRNHSQARVYLARTLMEQGRIPDALRELDVLVAVDHTPSVKFQVGEIARELAERRFADLGRAAPGSPALHELAGRQFEIAGQLNEALKEYEAAASLAPNRPGIHYWLGSVLWRMRRLDEAKRELLQELSITPHHGMANLRLGQTLIAMNDAQSAVAPLELAVQALPGSLIARKELGTAYFKVERNADARREWEAVAAQLPNDDQIHYLLGGLYRKIGEPSRAQAEFATHREILERRRALSEAK